MDTEVESPTETQLPNENLLAAASSLIGDHARKGLITPDDIARVAEKRSLEPEELDQLLRQLKSQGIVAVESNEGADSRRRYLTAEEERRLANMMRLARRVSSEPDSGNPRLARIVRDGERARERFISSNQGLVWWTARRFRRAGLDLEDMIQEGMKGLIKAVEMFDPDLGYKFSTYATWWIRQSIQRGIDDTGSAIRIPVHRLDTIRRLRKMKRRLAAETGSEPSIPRLAAALDWPIEKTAFIAELAEMRPIAIDGPLSDDTRETLENVILRDPAPNPEETAVQIDLRRNLELVLAGLPTRTQDIVRRRFGLENGIPETLEQIGQDYGITRERIRQIEEKALRMLKKSKSGSKLKTFIDLK